MTAPEILGELAAALRKSGVPFVVGGSFASSAWGQPRQTNDVDIEVLFESASAESFVSHLGSGYLVNFEELRDALCSNTEYPSFQVLQLEEAFKADMFVLRDDEYTRTELERAVEVEIQEGITLPFLAAENIVLHKLRWFVAGGKVSDRQWNDIVQVLETQQGRLDNAYLLRWAAHFNVVAELQLGLASVADPRD